MQPLRFRRRTTKAIFAISLAKLAGATILLTRPAKYLRNTSGRYGLESLVTCERQRDRHQKVLRNGLQKFAHFRWGDKGPMLPVRERTASEHRAYPILPKVHEERPVRFPKLL